MSQKTEDQRKKQWPFPIVGVTGIIGSGKSTVARLFGELGAAVFDADQAAREVSADPETLQEVARQFGQEVLDARGHLNRQKMAQMVFSRPSRLRELNAIIHPRVRQRMWEFVERAAAQAPPPMVIIDAPLIYETDLYQFLDFVVVVSAEEKDCIERVKIRNGWPEEAIRRRMNSQLPLSEKRSRADFVIENDGRLEELMPKTRSVFDKILKIWQEKQAQ